MVSLSVLSLIVKFIILCRFPLTLIALFLFVYIFVISVICILLIIRIYLRLDSPLYCKRVEHVTSKLELQAPLPISDDADIINGQLLNESNGNNSTVKPN